MKKGRIFEIREFTLHDGPGVRTTVFFKGCPRYWNEVSFENIALPDGRRVSGWRRDGKVRIEFRKTRKGKTTILIAHRITTIQDLDKVLFIDDGKIAAFGTHEELCATCKEYKKMVDLQRLEDELGGVQ